MRELPRKICSERSTAKPDEAELPKPDLHHAHENKSKTSSSPQKSLPLQALKFGSDLTQLVECGTRLGFILVRLGFSFGVDKANEVVTDCVAGARGLLRGNKKHGWTRRTTSEKAEEKTSKNCAKKKSPSTKESHKPSASPLACAAASVSTSRDESDSASTSAKDNSLAGQEIFPRTTEFFAIRTLTSPYFPFSSRIPKKCAHSLLLTTADFADFCLRKLRATAMSAYLRRLKNELG
ncbi:unnamed protein product, partial [Amoebophrya sp. A120]|eukprot:GSA120T00010277001.1